MVRILPLLLLPLMFSCSASKGATQPGGAPSSQETYEYGTCQKARDECPRERTLACALMTIASRYNACGNREDCVAADVDAKCSDSGSCPPLYVNRKMKAEFEAEAQLEIDKYCGNPSCKSSGLCGITSFEAQCADSHCTWKRAPVWEPGRF